MTIISTVLTDEEILSLMKGVHQEDHTKEGWVHRQRILMGKAIEQAVLAKVQAQQAVSQDADTRRMDFIEGHPGHLHVARLGHKTKQAWAFRSPTTNYEYELFPTARQAIDAARSCIEGE